MKSKKNNEQSSSVKKLLSLQASKSLLESTETFNSKQYVVNDSQVDIESNLNDDSSSNQLKEKKIFKLCLKPMLAIFGLIAIVGTILALLCLLDSFILEKERRFNTSNNTFKFTWSHCGQTYYKPSINPNSLRKLSKRIVGGEDAVEHSWPFLASVRLKLNKSEHHCGGTVITDQYVLTAAHCLLPYLKMALHLKMNITEMFSLMEVHVGINEHEKDPEHLTNEHVYHVEYFDFHERFNFSEFSLVHDIAILKLSRKINLNRPEVNVVCLPSQNDSVYKVKNGENVVALGWGSYAEEFNYTAYVWKNLQQGVFTIVDHNNEICNAGIIGKHWDKKYTICANGNQKKMVTCYGDSGGPVLAYRNNRWILVGIISYGHDTRDSKTNKKKCNASMPFYFVKVKAYLEWINKKTNFSLNKFQ